jgi:hypothetical protein
MSNPLITLYCSCCGQPTLGRQWWNRDKGYGLCSGCAKGLRDKGDLEIYINYGTRGVHYEIDQH